MFPLLFSIGPVHIYTISVLVVCAWLVFSFIFWKQLRGNGIDEEKIFDLTFWATIWGAMVARIVYVVLNWKDFSGAWLKVPAIWVAPGFSLYGAFVGALLCLVVLSKVKRIRLGYILDAVAYAFPVAIIVGLTGAFFDGSVPGVLTNLPWAVRYSGETGLRHPVQIYEILILSIVIYLVFRLQQRGKKEKWPFGAVGVWFLLLYTVPMFILEFFKATHVYWISLRANQWILLAMFAESTGAFYVRCGGREATRPLFNNIQKKFAKLVGGIYAKFSK